ncbi:MAG: hypothetical protein KF802_11485 [Bdellovibrionaceae bacterium]|nr:hypothetical protein [Pseudobdellovibrionaceae bacterium]MBX3032740.1 hypothetical protein [Pseudobdellovibrionaceae bacterium]
MKLPSSDWKFLLLTAFVVLLLGVQTVSDAVGEEDNAFDLAARQAESERAPASLPEFMPRPSGASFRDALLELDWSCPKSPATEVRIKGGQLRLHGKSCAEGFSAERLSITNETNGFTASVFDKGRHEYETDLIQLREGANKIRLQYMNSSGKTVEKILTVNAVSAI